MRRRGAARLHAAAKDVEQDGMRFLPQCVIRTEKRFVLKERASSVCLTVSIQFQILL